MNSKRERVTPSGTVVSIHGSPPEIYCYHPDEDDRPEPIGFVLDSEAAVFINEDAYSPDVLRAIASLIEEN